ncbi:polyprenyl synthetase family protein [Candidatus Curtissbacteria bacterium]|nr:polyprenyl synthetase family protein [Candidatus Curtissbacteria bacterium]
MVFYANMDGLLQEELGKFLAVFEPYAARYFREKVKAGAKYSPLISKLYGDLADFSSRGKKLRAFLVYLGFLVGKGSLGSRRSRGIEKVLPVCLAYEIVHNFLLIHDDIIDRSEKRRGKPTMHKRYEKFFGAHYGGSQAMIIGDVAFIEAMRLINEARFDAGVKNETFSKMLDILLLTAWGQALDVEYAFRQATFGQIWEMVKLKAAKYSVIGPLTIGAQLAGASRGQQKAIADYGEKVGIAFQIQDDILGVFGDEKVLGKSTLSDMREGKNTILIYKTREMARSEDKKTIDRLWGKKDGHMSDIRVIGRIIERSGALEWCRKENRQLIEQAKSAVLEITEDSHLKTIFNQLAEYVATRQS